MDDLRHDLREADEERYYLEAALNDAANDWLRTCNSSPNRWTYPFATHTVAKVAALCAAAGLFLAAGLAWPQLRALDKRQAAASVRPQLPPAPLIAPAPILQQAPVSLRSPHVTSAPSASRLHATKVKQRNQIGGHLLIRPPTPRPLSPAEFGRRAVPAS